MTGVSALFGRSLSWVIIWVFKWLPRGSKDRENLESLIGLGCDHAQGFFFSQPLPRREFETWYHASEEVRIRGNAKRPTVASTLRPTSCLV